MLTLRNIGLNLNGDNGDAKEILKNINLTFESGKIVCYNWTQRGGKTSLPR